MFTTPENSIAGSAICSFNLTSIENTFKGPFKTRENQDPTKTWRPDNSVQPQQRTGFECERPLPGPSGVDAVDSQKYQLMDEAVETTTFGPAERRNLTNVPRKCANCVFTFSLT